MQMYDHIDDDFNEGLDLAQQAADAAHDIKDLADKIKDAKEASHGGDKNSDAGDGAEAGDAPEGNSSGESSEGLNGDNPGASAEGSGAADSIGGEPAAAAGEAGSGVSGASKAATATGGTTTASEDAAIAGTMAQHGAASSSNAAVQGSTAAANTAAAAQQGSAAAASASTAAASGTAATGAAVGTAAAVPVVGWIIAALIALLSSKKVRNGIFACIIAGTFAISLIFVVIFRYGSSQVIELDEDPLKKYEDNMVAMDEGIIKSFEKVKDKIRKEARQGGYDEDLTMAFTDIDLAQDIQYDPFLLLAVYSTVNEQESTNPRNLRKILEDADLFPYTTTPRSKMVTEPYLGPDGEWYDEEKTFTVQDGYDDNGDPKFVEITMGTPVQVNYLEVELQGFNMDAACAALGMSLNSPEADALYQPTTSAFSDPDSQGADVLSAIYGEDGVLDKSSNDTYLQHILDMAEETEVLVFGTIKGQDIKYYGQEGDARAIIKHEEDLEKLKTSLEELRNIIESIPANDTDDFNEKSEDPSFDLTSYKHPFTSKTKEDYMERLDEALTEVNGWTAGRNISSKALVETEDLVAEIRSIAFEYNFTEEQKTQVLGATRESSLSFRAASINNGLLMKADPDAPGGSSYYTFDDEGNLLYDEDTGLPQRDNSQYEGLLSSIDASSAAGALRKKVVASALTWEGVRYSTDYNDRVNGIDCSTLVAYSYRDVDELREIGNFLNQTSEGQYIWAESVDIVFHNESLLREGDLVFYARWKNGAWRRPNRYLNISHVAMYIGDGKLMHAVGSNDTGLPPAQVQNMSPSWVDGASRSNGYYKIRGYASPILYYMQTNGLVDDSGSYAGVTAKKTSASMKSKDYYGILKELDYVPDSAFATRTMQVEKYSQTMVERDWDSAPEILYDGKRRTMGTAAMSKSMIMSIASEFDDESGDSINPLGTIVEIGGILYKVREYSGGEYRHENDVILLFEENHQEALKWNNTINLSSTASVKFYRYGFDTTGDDYDKLRAYPGR